MLAFVPLACVLGHFAPQVDDPARQESVQTIGSIADGCALRPAKKFRAPDRLPLLVRWSFDGSCAAYVGHRGEDGAEAVPVLQRAGEAPLVGEAYDFVDPPVFAADAARVAFRVGETVSKDRERWFVWLDGEPSYPEDWIGAVALSPDGGSVAYWAQPGARLEKSGAYAQKPLVLRVHEESGRKRKKRRPKQWEDARALQAPVFSADSKRVFGLGLREGRWFVVGQGRKGFEPIGGGSRMASDLQVARNGKVLAYSGLVEELERGAIQQQLRVVLNDEVVASSFARTGSASLSADGKRLALKYMSFRGTMGVVIAGQKKAGPGFDYVGRPVWDADGDRIAFASVTDAGGVDPESLQLTGTHEPSGGEWALTLWRRGKAAKTCAESFERLRDPVFGPKGKLVAARVLDQEGWRVALFDTDGVLLQLGPEHTEVSAPRFDVGGASVVYGVRDERALGWASLSVKD